MTIYSHYKKPKVRRGTLDAGVFYRDNTPLVFDKFISLEPDVLDQLERLGCTRLRFRTRDNNEFITTLAKFKAAQVRDIGVPDKRPQHLYDTTKKETKDQATFL
jgi:hypothetical protein